MNVGKREFPWMGCELLPEKNQNNQEKPRHDAPTAGRSLQFSASSEYAD